MNHCFILFGTVNAILKCQKCTRSLYWLDWIVIESKKGFFFFFFLILQCICFCFVRENIDLVKKMKRIFKLKNQFKCLLLLYFFVLYCTILCVTLEKKNNITSYVMRLLITLPCLCVHYYVVEWSFPSCAMRYCLSIMMRCINIRPNKGKTKNFVWTSQWRLDLESFFFSLCCKLD